MTTTDVPEMVQGPPGGRIAQLRSVGLFEWFLCSFSWPESVSRNLRAVQADSVRRTRPRSGSHLASELLVILLPGPGPLPYLGAISVPGHTLALAGTPGEELRTLRGVASGSGLRFSALGPCRLVLWPDELPQLCDPEERLRLGFGVTSQGLTLSPALPLPALGSYLTLPASVAPGEKGCSSTFLARWRHERQGKLAKGQAEMDRSLGFQGPSISG